MPDQKNIKLVVLVMGVSVLWACGCFSTLIAPSQIAIDADYTITGKTIVVSVKNCSFKDVLLDIPADGIEYMLEYELPDGSLEVQANCRIVDPYNRVFRPLSGVLRSGHLGPWTTFTFKINVTDNSINWDKYYKLTILVNVVPIDHTNKYTTVESLHKAFLDGCRTIEFVTVHGVSLSAFPPAACGSA